MNLRPRLCFLSCIALAAASGIGCSTSAAESSGTTESAVSGIPIGDVRGVVDVTKTLRTRLLDDTDPMTASFDVSRVAGPVFRLRRQLGVFALEGTTSTYLGGTPTPLRATLWHQVMGRIATSVGDVCLSDPTTLANGITFVAYATGAEGVPIRPTTFHLRPQVTERILKVCAFHGDETARRQVAGELFDTFMGIGGTLAAERDALTTELATDGAPSVAADPKERVTNMVLAMLLNPHFLLAK
jgi:hypothetical protein